MKGLLIFLISGVATPAIMLALSAIVPPSRDSEFDHIPTSTLYARNTWVDRTGQCICLLGIAVPWYYADAWALDDNLGWSIGLIAGLMVAFAYIFYTLATLPRGGLDRFREFFRFYELKHGIGAYGVHGIAILATSIGAISVWQIAS